MSSTVSRQAHFRFRNRNLKDEWLDVRLSSESNEGGATI